MTYITETDIEKGQAIYTPFMLGLYNIWVLDISNSWIWRCPKKIQLELFNRYVTANHCDIGVGTGYYLKQCKWPPSTRLSLMDLNPNCLKAASKLSQDFKPLLFRHDIFKSCDQWQEHFDSISMNYLLHCLPGTMETKSLAIANAVTMLKTGGTLFGATILADEHLHTKISQSLCNFYNKKQIFSNNTDTVARLQKALSQHLTDIEIQVVGCVALFKGTANLSRKIKPNSDKN